VLWFSLGTLLFSGCSEPTASSPETDERSPHISTPARFAVTSPARAAMIQAGTLDDWPVRIAGRACDPVSPITSLTIGGVPLAVTGDRLCEPFEVEQPSRWGLTVIRGRAADAAGDTGVLAQSFLRSPAYFPTTYAPTPEGRVPHALIAQLNQPLIDDGDRSDIDDIATLAWHAVAGLDWDGLIPSALAADPDADGDGEVDRARYNCLFYHQTNPRTGYRIRKERFAFTAVEAGRVEARPGGLDVEMAISGPAMQITVTGYLDLGCAGGLRMSAPGSVRASSLNASATLQVSLGADGVPHAEPARVEVTTPGLSVDVEWSSLEPIDFLFDELLGDIVDSYARSIRSEVEAVIRSEVGPLVEELLASLTLPAAIEIPLPTGTNLSVEAGLDWLAFEQGFGQIGMYAQIVPQAPRQGPAPPFGAIRRDGDLPTFPTDRALGVGIKDDLLNQLLWAAWQGGAFDFADLAGLGIPLSLEGVEIAVHAAAPPVVMPGRDANGIELGIGDVYVEASIERSQLGDAGAAGPDPIEAGIYVSVLAGGSLAVDHVTNRLSIDVARSPQVDVQVAEINDPGYESRIHSLLSLGLRDLLPGLLADALSGLPLPEFDLGSIDGVPPDTRWRLRNAETDRQGSYHRLSGDLQGQ
jgi:hypothetical protein